MVTERDEIDWREQCKFCNKGINTTHCYKFERFCDSLQNFIKDTNAHATVDLTCDYFCLDKKIYDEYKAKEDNKENGEN